MRPSSQFGARLAWEIRDHATLFKITSLAALKHAGCPVVSDFPKTSPDLNAIENAWKLVRKRLQETDPVGMESREAFIARLRRCVSWINEHKSDELLNLCTNRKGRASDVLNAVPCGSKTKW